jgi:molybdate transport system regulatory protein
MKPFGKKQLNLRSSQWIVDDDGNIVIGKGRMELLEYIDSTGSINQAAKAMKMSYKAAWSKLKATEAHLNTKIVVADKRDGTHLTPEGRELLDKFRALRKECLFADDRIFLEIFG